MDPSQALALSGPFQNRNNTTPEQSIIHPVSFAPHPFTRNNRRLRCSKKRCVMVVSLCGCYASLSALLFLKRVLCNNSPLCIRQWIPVKNVFSAVRIIAAMVVAAHYVFLLGFCVCVGVADDCACYSCSDFVVLLVPIGFAAASHCKGLARSRVEEVATTTRWKQPSRRVPRTREERKRETRKILTRRGS